MQFRDEDTNFSSEPERWIDVYVKDTKQKFQVTRPTYRYSEERKAPIVGGIKIVTFTGMTQDEALNAYVLEPLERKVRDSSKGVTLLIDAPFTPSTTFVLENRLIEKALEQTTKNLKGLLEKCNFDSVYVVDNIRNVRIC